MVEQKLELLRQRKSLVIQKENDKSNIPVEERSWLLKTRKVLESNPQWLEGRMKLYISQFQKPYKISKKDFLDLLSQAEIQEIEKIKC